jgi:hypothetical protein
LVELADPAMAVAKPRARFVIKEADEADVER